LHEKRFWKKAERRKCVLVIGAACWIKPKTNGLIILCPVINRSCDKHNVKKSFKIVVKDIPSHEGSVLVANNTNGIIYKRMLLNTCLLQYYEITLPEYEKQFERFAEALSGYNAHLSLLW